MPQIHPTAVVEEGALLAEDVRVGPFSYIQSGAQIGAGTEIRSNCTITRWVRLGQSCTVYPGAVLGEDPQDVSFKPSTQSYVQIGDRCTLREMCTVHRGTAPDTVTRVGNDCLIMATAHVAHNAQVGNGVIMANGVLLAGHVTVGDRAFISGNVTVHQFVRIGALCMLSGLSALGMDLPPYCVLENSASNKVVGLNVVGMRRAGISAEARLEIKRAYKALYQRGLNLREGIQYVRSQSWCPEAQVFADFLEGVGPRGIASPA